MEGFIATLSSMHNGNVVVETDRLLADLVQSVRHTGKPGSISVTITVAPASKGMTDVLAVTDKVTVKSPVREKGASIFYPQADGSLSRKDTRQQELDLKVVTMDEPASLKEVG